MIVLDAEQIINRINKYKHADRHVYQALMKMDINEVSVLFTKIDDEIMTSEIDKLINLPNKP